MELAHPKRGWIYFLAILLLLLITLVMVPGTA